MLRAGVLAGLGEGVYIALVSLFMMTAGNRWFSNGETPTLTFAMFLLLFVFSAGLSGLIVFGYPVYLVSQRKFREAILTVAMTLITLVLLLFVTLCFYLLVRS